MKFQQYPHTNKINFGVEKDWYFIFYKILGSLVHYILYIFKFLPIISILFGQTCVMGKILAGDWTCSAAVTQATAVATPDS